MIVMETVWELLIFRVTIIKSSLNHKLIAIIFTYFLGRIRDCLRLS